MQTECVEIDEPLHNFRYIDEAGKLQTLKIEVDQAYETAKRLGKDAHRYLRFIAGTFDPAPLVSSPCTSSSSLALYNRLCSFPTLGNITLLIESLQLDIDHLFKLVEINNKGKL